MVGQQYVRAVVGSDQLGVGRRGCRGIKGSIRESFL